IRRAIRPAAGSASDDSTARGWRSSEGRAANAAATAMPRSSGPRSAWRRRLARSAAIRLASRHARPMTTNAAPNPVAASRLPNCRAARMYPAPIRKPMPIASMTPAKARRMAARRARPAICSASPVNAAPSRPLSMGLAPEHLGQDETDARGNRQRGHRLFPNMFRHFLLEIAGAMAQSFICLAAGRLERLDALRRDIAGGAGGASGRPLDLRPQPGELILEHLDLPGKIGRIAAAC